MVFTCYFRNEKLKLKETDDSLIVVVTQNAGAGTLTFTKDTLEKVAEPLVYSQILTGIFKMTKHGYRQMLLHPAHLMTLLLYR